MELSDLIVIIPALDPDEKMIQLIQGLREEGFVWILVIDDGSGPESEEVFKKAQAMECLFVRHDKNLGKGATIKTAIRTIMTECENLNGCVMADADGQHLPADIRRVAEAMTKHPDILVLGVRDFGKGQVPLKSKLGNRITSVFFRLTNGMSCPDTQTGLRGIPKGLLNLALLEEGDRYEYEMKVDMLLFFVSFTEKNLTKFNILINSQNKNPICKMEMDRYNFMNSKENVDLSEKGIENV